MIIKALIDEDFLNYKEPAMYIGTAYCDGKCCKEAGIPLSVCQNDAWRMTNTIEMPDSEIIKRYLSNDITNAICFAGLEPFEQFEDICGLISKLRTEYHCDDAVVIYTGYNKDEIRSQIDTLATFKNIVVKFGRYIPNHKKHYDPVLGVYLVSDNQYAEAVS